MALFTRAMRVGQEGQSVFGVSGELPIGWLREAASLALTRAFTAGHLKSKLFGKNPLFEAVIAVEHH